MINKELPFVTSCGIYENPDRVKAVVNTEDEDLLAKLRALRRENCWKLYIRAELMVWSNCKSTVCACVVLLWF